MTRMYATPPTIFTGTPRRRRPPPPASGRPSALQAALSIALLALGTSPAWAGGFITSGSNATLAVNAYGGARHRAEVRIVNNCPIGHPDCQWIFRGGMIVSAANPNLAWNAYGGARSGAEVRIVSDCAATNPDCTWSIDQGMIVSNANRRLAVNAYGGAQHGTLLKLVDNCSPALRDCTWNFTAGTQAPVPRQIEFHPPIGDLGALTPEVRDVIDRVRILPDGRLAARCPTGVCASTDPLTADARLLWVPGTELKVHIKGGSAALRGRVQQTARQWMDHANIRFIFTETLPADIRVSIDDSGFSWSLIGRMAQLVPFDIPTMTLGWLTDESSDSEVRRVVLHEFGHALGLVHEHQSPAAGIAWDKEAVYRDYQEKKPPWDKAAVDINVFQTYNATQTNYSNYDPRSIMQYPIPARHTLNGFSVGWNTELSEVDKRTIRQWYPFPTAESGSMTISPECDRIDFAVTHDRFDPFNVRVSLASGASVTSAKLIGVPRVGNGKSELQVNKGWLDLTLPNTVLIPVTELDRSRPIQFEKAGFVGKHFPLAFSWDVLPALPPGSHLRMTWVSDRCS